MILESSVYEFFSLKTPYLGWYFHGLFVSYFWICPQSKQNIYVIVNVFSDEMPGRENCSIFARMSYSWVYLLLISRESDKT